jgi:mono/diheme cytochrome c family protein
MKRWRRIMVWTAAALLAVPVAVIATAWCSSELAMRQRFVVDDPPLPVAGDGAVAHGRHVYESRGCADCHGMRGEGRVVLDVAPLRMVASNLTPAGRGGLYDADTFARAIRHGVAHDGAPLRLMPIVDYKDMSDDDAAALVAYLASLDPVDSDPGATQVHLLGRVLHLFGQIDLVPAAGIDHAPRQRIAPPAAVSFEYGGYLAHTCRGCHGVDYRGQRIPGTPPDVPPASDLTALGDWTSDDFTRVMREGLRPDGRALHPIMPWQAFRAMTDEELSALWMYFDGLADARGALPGSAISAR